MTVVGKHSGNIFEKRDILNPEKYLKMLEEPLFRKDGDGEQVIPVRNQASPHFRAPPLQRRVGIGERDAVHTACIVALHQALQGGAVQISSPTFVENNRNAVGQVFFQTKAANDYQWWSDSSGTRIPLGAGNYIQPDICGRESNPSSFCAGPKAPNVIIEVIQSHYPEEATLYELVRLSTCNHIVVFYFIRSPEKMSKYSYFRRVGMQSLLEVSAVYILHQGGIHANGKVKYEPPSADRADFANWYAIVEADLFLPVMKSKDKPPLPKGNPP